MRDCAARLDKIFSLSPCKNFSEGNFWKGCLSLPTQSKAEQGKVAGVFLARGPRLLTWKKLSETTKQEWIDACLRFARCSADLWSRDQKILRQRRITFHNWDNSLTPDDVGYTGAKLTTLERHYLHDESRDAAVKLWELIRSKGQYKSAAFSTFNHVIKNGSSFEEAAENKSSIGSVQGPCMLAVTVTWLAKDQVAIDVPYRSTEVLKKFPADVVLLRDVLLTPFDFSGMEITVTANFTNMTLHPMYLACILPHLDDMLGELDRIKERDPTFHHNVVKRTAGYVCPEYGKGIANHSQSLRVQKFILSAIKGRKLRELQEYLRNHL